MCNECKVYVSNEMNATRIMMVVTILGDLSSAYGDLSPA